MRRFASFLLGNWPLKLGAIVLATVLYGGVVLSESTRTWPGQVPIDILNAPRDAAVLDQLPSVTDIQYRAALDVASQLTNGSFRASIDLSGVQPGAGPTNVDVILRPIDDRVRIVGFSPPRVNIRVDRIITRMAQVTADAGAIPPGLKVGTPTVTPASVELLGASSRVASVRSVVARVAVDNGAVNVDEEVDVIPIDDSGNRVANVEVTPGRVRVHIDIQRDLTQATLAVVPKLTGQLPSGYELGAISVSPLSVTVSGETRAVEQMAGIQTEPIDVSGKTAPFEADVGLVVPAGVALTDSQRVHVSLVVAPATASRTIESGLQIEGGQPDLVYTLSRPSVLVILSGPAPDLDRLAPSDIHASLPVGGLAVGTHEVAVDVQRIAGMSVLAVTPATVGVDIGPAPPATARPGTEASPSPSFTPGP